MTVTRTSCLNRSEVIGWSFFNYGLKGMCHTQLAYLSLARLLARLEPRRSGSSAALIDEPGSDGHRTPEPSLVLGVEILIALSAKLNEELGISSDTTRGRWLRPRHSERSPGAAA